jgi:hypothetical protein
MRLGLAFAVAAGAIAVGGFAGKQELMGIGFLILLIATIAGVERLRNSR